MFLLNKFKNKNWIKFTPARRQDILQQLENKMAKKFNRQALPISINTNTNWNCFGAFEYKGTKKILKINIELITKPALRFQAMSTILHEGRHATQFHISNNDPAWFQFSARRWKKNIQNYVSFSQNKDLYAMQEIELDAQLFTKKMLLKWSRKFKNELDFQKTLSNLLHQIEHTEKEAKLRFGKFYRYKINKAIKKQNKIN